MAQMRQCNCNIRIVIVALVGKLPRVKNNFCLIEEFRYGSCIKNLSRVSRRKNQIVLSSYKYSAIVKMTIYNNRQPAALYL